MFTRESFFDSSRFWDLIWGCVVGVRRGEECRDRAVNWLEEFQVSSIVHFVCSVRLGVERRELGTVQVGINKTGQCCSSSRALLNVGIGFVLGVSVEGGYFIRSIHRGGDCFLRDRGLCRDVRCGGWSGERR